MNNVYILIIIAFVIAVACIVLYSFYIEDRYQKAMRKRFGNSNKDALTSDPLVQVRESEGEAKDSRDRKVRASLDANSQGKVPTLSDPIEAGEVPNEGLRPSFSSSTNTNKKNAIDEGGITLKSHMERPADPEEEETFSTEELLSDVEKTLKERKDDGMVLQSHLAGSDEGDQPSGEAYFQAASAPLEKNEPKEEAKKEESQPQKANDKASFQNVSSQKGSDDREPDFGDAFGASFNSFGKSSNGDEASNAADKQGASKEAGKGEPDPFFQAAAMDSGMVKEPSSKKSGGEDISSLTGGFMKQGEKADMSNIEAAPLTSSFDENKDLLSYQAQLEKEERTRKIREEADLAVKEAEERRKRKMRELKAESRDDSQEEEMEFGVTDFMGVEDGSAVTSVSFGTRPAEPKKERRVIGKASIKASTTRDSQEEKKPESKPHEEEAMATVDLGTFSAAPKKEEAPVDPVAEEKGYSSDDFAPLEIDIGGDDEKEKAPEAKMNEEDVFASVADDDFHGGEHKEEKEEKKGFFSKWFKKKDHQEAQKDSEGQDPLAADAVKAEESSEDRQARMEAQAKAEAVDNLKKESSDQVATSDEDAEESFELSNEEEIYLDDVAPTDYPDEDSRDIDLKKLSQAQPSQREGLLVDPLDLAQMDLSGVYQRQIDYLIFVGLKDAQTLSSLPRLSSVIAPRILGYDSNNRLVPAMPDSTSIYKGFVIGLPAISQNHLLTTRDVKEFCDMSNSFVKNKRGGMVLTDVATFMDDVRRLDTLVGAYAQKAVIYLESNKGITEKALSDFLQDYPEIGVSPKGGYFVNMNSPAPCIKMYLLKGENSSEVLGLQVDIEAALVPDVKIVKDFCDILFAMCMEGIMDDIYDHNQELINGDQMDKMFARIEKIHANMRAHGMAPGGYSARRLFFDI